MISYLQVEQLTKTYGDLTVFENITLGIAKEEKVALVARNGAGKSTLLKIIAGTETADTGEIIFRNDISVGYLPQIPELHSQHTIMEEMVRANADVREAISQYHQAMQTSDPALMEKAFANMDRLNAWELDVKINRLLDKLKLPDTNRKIGTLSGGEQKRVALAAILMDNPDLLILDEPTNHLDLDIIEWLEEYLESNKVTLLMVTHDRYFLDRVCNKIIELDENNVFEYQGNYSYFLQKRQERLHAFQVEVERAQNQLRKEEEWMRRMPKARGHKAKYRIDNYHQLKDTASQKRSDQQLQLDMKSSRLGKKVVNLKHASKAFEDLNLLDDFSYAFAKGEKIGVVGRNGAGKSTFLNLITGSLPLDKGEIEIGQTIKFGYYRQEGLTFDEEKRVIDIIKDIAEVIHVGKDRKMSPVEFLNYFLFPPSMHYVKVRKLSGGEKRRLYLMTVLVRQPNFLILDEPTNDLDIMTLAVLEEYLADFQGCVVIVSHDRFFMDVIVDHLFVFEGNGKIKDYPGNYSQYRQWKKDREKEAARAETKKQQEQEEQKAQQQADEEKRKQRYANRLSFNEKREYEQLEMDIEQLESEKSELEQEMNSGTLSHQQLAEKAGRVAEIIESVDEKTLRWLELSERAE